MIDKTWKKENEMEIPAYKVTGGLQYDTIKLLKIQERSLWHKTAIISSG
ncbi:hypothetical protein [Nitrosomonas sp.]|nr:hypothetical protein [Nitrosomonas sp.]MCW5601531.1 hypothetical protein [Nitrosomonas sp.]